MLALNTSVADGWWAEGYDDSHGWRIGEDRDYAEGEDQDGPHAESLYSILAAAGYLEKEELLSFRKSHSRLQGHCENMWLPILDVSTVSLGQGLSQDRPRA